MLLVWLFGITAGIANACVADIGGQPSDGASVASAAPIEVAALPCPLHHGAQESRASPSQADCLDYCTKSKVSIASLKSAPDHADDGAPPQLAIATVCPIPASLPVSLPLPRREGAAAPPIRIAFLRLAL